MSDEFWQRASKAQTAAYAVHHLLYVLNCETEEQDAEVIDRRVRELWRRDRQLRAFLDALYAASIGGEEV
jgi:hypothetical protein